MKTHIEQTLHDIDGRIEQLRQLRQTIVVNFGAEPVSPPAILVAPPAAGLENLRRQPAAKKPAKLKRASAPEKTSTPARPTVKGPGRGPRVDPAIIAQVRKLPEPFNVKVLVANGIFKSVGGAYSFLYRSLERGHLEKAGLGQFKRTKTFGADEATPSNTLAQIHSEMNPETAA